MFRRIFPHPLLTVWIVAVWVLLNNEITVDELAHHFGTIGYEVLTSLGKRYVRAYKGG